MNVQIITLYLFAFTAFVCYMYGRNMERKLRNVLAQWKKTIDKGKETGAHLLEAWKHIGEVEKLNQAAADRIELLESQLLNMKVHFENAENFISASGAFMDYASFMVNLKKEKPGN